MEPNKKDEKRNSDGTYATGTSGGPGRPKGKTLKEFARDMLMSMSDEEKIEYMSKLPKEIVWKMAEGNPENKSDLTSNGKSIIFIPSEIANKNEINTSTESHSE